jgi:hypothetical protein
MVIDPDDHILNVSGLIQKDITVLDIAGLSFDVFTVQPNPTSDSWLVKGLPANTSCTLIDMTGRVLWTQTADGDAMVPAKELVAGTYNLLLQKAGMRPVSARLVKY